MVDMRKLIAAAAIVAGVLAGGSTAFADPDFGPGNSSKGPDGKCHEPAHGTGPGSHEPVPGCKG